MTSDLDYPSHLGARDAPDHPDATHALAERVHELEKTVSRLWAALATRETIGMAKGILIATEHCNPDEAFDILRRASQRTNRRVTDIAADIVAFNSAGRPSQPRNPHPR